MVTATPLCLVDELTAKPAVFRHGARKIAAVMIDGRVHAFDAVCPHWGGPLGAGRVSAARLEVECPWHRFRYSLLDGRCTASTGRAALSIYTVAVRDGAVYLDDATVGGVGATSTA